MRSLLTNQKRVSLGCLLIYTFLNSLSCGPIGPNYNYWDIESFDSTYMRFNFPDLGPESRYFPPGIFVTERDKKTYYLTAFLENDWLPNRNLLPDAWYWKKFYSNWDDLPPIIQSSPKFNFISGCEYYVPAPVGKFYYSLFSFNRNHANVGGGRISKAIDLQPGQSVRIHFRIPESIGEGKVDLKKYIGYQDGDQILFSIEPTPLHMDKPGCEFVK